MIGEKGILVTIVVGTGNRVGLCRLLEYISLFHTTSNQRRSHSYKLHNHYYSNCLCSGYKYP
jgi:hypothetical protein